MDKRFGFLRLIATIFRILAWIALVLGVLIGIGVLVVGLAGSGSALPGGSDPGVEALLGVFGGVLGGALGLLGSVLISLFCFLCLSATAEAVHLALAIEENTRETAWYLKGGDTLRR